MDELKRLADLIQARTAIDDSIAALLGRPAERGHAGEYIAAAVFGIRLEQSASCKGSDGVFVAGPLAERSVNVKWYGKHEGLLDINPHGQCDFYLVLAGPGSVALSSRGSTRPWVISSVFLFDVPALMAELQQRGVKIGIATSVHSELWRRAQIYPEQTSSLLILSPEQRRLLALFAP